MEREGRRGEEREEEEKKGGDCELKRLVNAAS